MPYCPLHRCWRPCCRVLRRLCCISRRCILAVCALAST